MQTTCAYEVRASIAPKETKLFAEHTYGYQRLATGGYPMQKTVGALATFILSTVFSTAQAQGTESAMRGKIQCEVTDQIFLAPNRGEPRRYASDDRDSGEVRNIVLSFLVEDDFFSLDFFEDDDEIIRPPLSFDLVNLTQSFSFDGLLGDLETAKATLTKDYLILGDANLSFYMDRYDISRFQGILFDLDGSGWRMMGTIISLDCNDSEDVYSRFFEIFSDSAKKD